MIKLSIVIPLFNEERRLKKTIPILKKFIKNNSRHKIELIFVSDGSTDKTNSIIKEFIFSKSKNFKKKIIKYSLTLV